MSDFTPLSRIDLPTNVKPAKPVDWACIKLVAWNTGDAA